MTGPVATVHLIDDDESFRTAIARILQFAGYRTREYASAGAFLLQQSAHPDSGCIVLDLQMPGPSGLELHEAISRMEDALPVIFLSGCGDVASTARAMKVGAVDFLVKPADRDTLLAAVSAAVARDQRRRAQSGRRRELEARFSELAPRERQVFEHVVAGKLNKQIAAALGIAERTVKAHRAQVMEKMHAASLAELVQMSARLQAGDEPFASE